MKGLWLVLVLFVFLGQVRAEEGEGGFESPFLGPNGEVRSLFRPEFRSAPSLLDDIARFGIEGLDAFLIGPTVPPPVPGKPQVPSRLLLRGPAEVVSRAREVLAFLDVPRPAVVVSLLVAEVRAIKDFERGGHVFWDRNAVEGTPDTIMRGAFGDYEPESFLRSSLTGYAPWQGTSVTFGNGPSDWAQNGVFELVLRMLQEERQATFLAWPTVVCTEGIPGTIESVLRQQDRVVTNSGSYVVVRTAELMTGITLTVTPVRIARDAAVLDVVADISHPEPESQSNNSPALRRSQRIRVKTRVTMRDRESMLIGGLRFRRRLGEKLGDPIFGDIPVVDLAASTKRKECVDTDLLILLKGRVLVPGPSVGPFLPPGEARRLSRQARKEGRTLR